RTPHGKRVLADLERRCMLIRIDRHPRPGDPPNLAFMNPNAALYRAGMLDQVEGIRKRIKRAEELDNAEKANSTGDGDDGNRKPASITDV
ncbi:MAG: hypothetical protein MJA83_10800, partial [Gammaproteobacteria bacterium]|nr:hypothetical protein [Gammaproteobacteria bacterium]